MCTGESEIPLPMGNSTAIINPESFVPKNFNFQIIAEKLSLVLFSNFKIPFNRLRTIPFQVVIEPNFSTYF